MYMHIYKDNIYLGKLCLISGPNQWDGDDCAKKEVSEHRLRGNEYNGFYETMRDGGYHGSFTSKHYKYNNDDPKIWKPIKGEVVIFFNGTNSLIENRIGIFEEYKDGLFFDSLGKEWDSINILHTTPKFIFGK